MANLHSLFTASMIFLKYSRPQTHVDSGIHGIYCYTVSPEKMDVADVDDLSKAGWEWDGFAWVLLT